MTDLFQSKQDQLKEWCRYQKFFSTSRVIDWGLKNYYNRAGRTARDFADETNPNKCLRRVDPEELRFMGIKSKEGYYRWIGNI